MVRYRVAVLLLMFLFLAIAIHQKIAEFIPQYFLAALALIMSYVSATTINDIVDEKIDKINHPHGRGRPLVKKRATKLELYFLNILTSLAALVLVIPLGWKAVLVMILSLIISYVYSIEPIKVSYRTHFAHIFLAIAYVIIPYLLGIAASNSAFIKEDFIFISAFTILFFGRIILKDFRDRRGDAKYGKPTFLLEYGKNLTCLISIISILIGNLILIFIALSELHTLILIILQFYFFCIYFMAYRLWKAKQLIDEQVAIAIGAKMGNGLLLTILGLFVIKNASSSQQIFFALTIFILFFISFILLTIKPDYANEGYRG